ncbi:MAG: efflux RND transporter periplasmic adaptor subunit [Ignavibacteria bacterium]
MRFILKSLTMLAFTLTLIIGCGNNSGGEKKEEHPEYSETEHSDRVNISQASIKEIGLKTESISLKQFTGFMNVPAKVIVNQDNEAQVGSLVQGRVQKVFVKVGDYVKAGQELMHVEGLEIGEIIAGYLTAKASLNFQKANFERQQTLIEQNVGSQKSFLEAQAEYEKALAEFNAQDKKIHSIGLSDEDVANGKGDRSQEHTSGTLPVKSPINGIVIERNVVIGQLVDGTTNAFKIININSVWIDGQIYEKDVNKINEKTNVLFTAASYPGEKFTGRINYIGQTIDEKSRTITIRAEFKNPNGKLKPQMFGEMHIPSDKNLKAILIPIESIIKIDNADFVFVQKEDSAAPDGGQAFEKRAVITGAAQDEFVEIKNGLRENEKVVIKGGFFLKSELMKEELEEDEH